MSRSLRLQAFGREPCFPVQPPPGQVPLSPGEVNFLYWFMQGSIMQLETRWALRKGWGLCSRHTAAWMLVECAFRGSYMHGPAVLYDDLMQGACDAFDVHGPAARWRLVRHLSASAPCHLCAMGMTPGSAGFIPGQRYAIGSDPSNWRSFANGTLPWWQEFICGRCSGSGSRVLCREHLVEELQLGEACEIDRHRLDVHRIARHLTRYHDAFSWDKQGSDTAEDRAALVSAAGWTGGWAGLLSLLGPATQFHLGKEQQC